MAPERELPQADSNRPDTTTTDSPTAQPAPDGQPHSLPDATEPTDPPSHRADAQGQLTQVDSNRPDTTTDSPAVPPRPGGQSRSLPRAGLAGRWREGVVILDVRRDSERLGGHVAGSLHIPLHEVRDRLAEIPDGTVWVHCAGGMRAAIAASLLAAAGRAVVAVDDGFAAAREAGLPMARVTPAEAHELTGADRTAVLVDVREAEEWTAGHAVGAVHAPLSALAAGASLPGSVQGRPLIAICRSGKRSREAAALLTARGAEVSDVVGGMRAWAEAGLPLVAESGPAAEARLRETNGSGPVTEPRLPVAHGNGAPTEAGLPMANGRRLPSEAPLPGVSGSRPAVAGPPAANGGRPPAQVRPPVADAGAEGGPVT
ncbi:rhodanese-like domain-containing protein [Streptomyces turgidiscabies]|nr:MULTISPECIES: rhodanese-like domain-containing protein [Streptomyces]MDX3491880.1 rhodanese-like domain-containing protein [Streptomyces turgidiscabies]